MKKRLLIICSIIGVLLAGFKFPIYAETTTPDYSSSTSIISRAALDQYFYDNYELLPYIESDGSQYINSSINQSSELRIQCVVSDLNDSELSTVFGVVDYDTNSRLAFRYDILSQEVKHFNFYSASFDYVYDTNLYQLINLNFDKNNIYLDNSLIHSFEYTSYSSNKPIYIFANNVNGTPDQYGNFKLYSLKIYDYSSESYVRDYYPARSKSGGIIGLYDAVSKTFVTTSGSVPFDSPTNDNVLNFQITDFLTASLSWIGAIFEGINEMPIIWVFIAIALAGVMFRWARRIVHF